MAKHYDLILLGPQGCGKSTLAYFFFGERGIRVYETNDTEEARMLSDSQDIPAIDITAVRWLSRGFGA